MCGSVDNRVEAVAVFNAIINHVLMTTGLRYDHCCGGAAAHIQ